jgi:hypothetical protein
MFIPLSLSVADSFDSVDPEPGGQKRHTKNKKNKKKFRNFMLDVLFEG